MRLEILIEVASIFSESSHDVVRRSLQKLPQILRPVYFGDSENGLNKRNQILEKELFERFAGEHPYGFFLFGGSGYPLYNLKIHAKSGFSELHMDLHENNEEYIVSFFETIVLSNPRFAYAADYEERKYRNRCYKTIGANRIEAWVGRDIHKYVPGLYFYTLLSEHLIGTHNVDFTSLVSAAASYDKTRWGAVSLA